MKITVNQLAALVNGTVEGDGSRIVERFSPIEEAEEGSLSFLSNMKYAQYLYTTQATAVLLDRNFQPEKETEAVLIRVDDVYTTLSALLDRFNQQENRKKGIENPSYIAASVKMGEEIYIGAFSYIGDNVTIGDRVQIYPQVYIGDNAEIGDNSIIYPGVKVYSDTSIGTNCILHSGCIIGSDGFGFAPQEDGSYKKIPQTGKVIIQDNVEIGANTTIDRATIKATVIEKGVKLDNLIQVAHNVEIGANTVIAAQAGISGSTKIGSGSAIGGQVGIVGHISIAEGSMIGAQSGVSGAITEKNGKWFGSPAVDHKSAMKAMVIFKKLPELYKRIQALEDAIEKR
jgi:UDP-3-O-[3-hydroxymyristoyl] glucosamine N-acyltransferase